jgi:hypothetical protein
MKKIQFSGGRKRYGGIFAVLILNRCTVLKRILAFSLIIAGCATQQKSTTESAPSVAALRSHVEYLASDGLEGRRTGTPGEALAADYIAAAFQKAGLQPKGTDGFLQAFPVSQGREIGPATTMSINGTALELHKEYFPLAYSHNGTIDANASISLLERGEPWFFDVAGLQTQNKSNPHFDLSSAVLNKANDAARKGATALFVYNSGKIEDGLGFKPKRASCFPFQSFI